MVHKCPMKKSRSHLQVLNSLLQYIVVTMLALITHDSMLCLLRHLLGALKCVPQR